MVVNMIKWRPWVQLLSKKYEVKIVIHSINGLQLINQEKIESLDDDDEKSKDFDGKLKVEIKWKGSKVSNGFRGLKKKGGKRNYTKEQKVSENGVVLWDEEFKRVCEFCGDKDKLGIEGGVFHPWDVSFLVLHNSKKRSNKMVPLTAPVVLNLAEYASLEDVKEFDINVPLSIINCGFNCSPSVCISLSLMELKGTKTTQELSVEIPKAILFAPLSPCFGASPLIKKDEAPTIKSSLRKVKSLTDFVSSKSSKKSYHGQSSSDSKLSSASDDSESNYPFDTDSLDCTEGDESEEGRDDADVQKSCGYGTIVHANLAGGAIDMRIDCEVDHLIYYGRDKSHMVGLVTHDYSTSGSEQVQRQSPKFGFSWSKGKLSFKSRRVKGEPLLKKDYGEEGGDDIDFYRRQFSSDESLTLDGSTASGSFISEFGDDNFAIGCWEQKDISSRDGGMKLQTQIFFASIDQRNERAAGESACTALVAVIADWLHSNQQEMPIKSEFDSLIREGSLQWRNLCENEDYREKFPDKHFDLETVIQAQIRPLSVIPERSFIGFFHPDGLEQECFGFLQGSMSFDNIWDEIYQAASKMNSDSEPLVYVVSWNDHFFILRVDWDAYYIIDTLGERLYEGCKQAYVLKFDKDTNIERLSSSKDEKTGDKESPIAEATNNEDSEVAEDKNEEEKVICRGKESCKEYIKSFLAAIPIRELQIDMKKGLVSSSTPLHHRLQIEFNFTKQFWFPPPPVEYINPEMAGDAPPLTAADMSQFPADDVPTVTASDVQASMVVDVPEPMMMVDFPGPKSAADVPVSIVTVAVA